jgi:hypothetical protein
LVNCVHLFSKKIASFAHIISSNSLEYTTFVHKIPRMIEYIGLDKCAIFTGVYYVLFLKTQSWKFMDEGYFYYREQMVSHQIKKFHTYVRTL